MSIKPISSVVTLALVFAVAAHSAEPGESPGRTLTSIQRLEPGHLAAARRDVLAIQEQRRSLPPIPGLSDYRAILHTHADDSAHTGGTLEEALADAIIEGVDVIMLSDHFRPPRDFMDGWRGLKNGVLFIPGSEMHGFLIHPEHSVFEEMSGPKEDLIKATTEGNGLIFLSHVEERMDHSMEGLTGMEIYNRHADANDDSAVLFQLVQWVTDPEKAQLLRASILKYPDEVLASQLDYPVEYFSKWDAETQHQRVVGIAANDCHHNQVFIVKMVDEETVLIGTNVDDDDEMRKLSAAMRPGIPELTKGHNPGDIVGRFDFDPYLRSFRNVSTHILAPELTEPAIRTALKQGHAYVSHDWMCDPEGTRFYLEGSDAIMGDERKYESGLQLSAQFPVECEIRILKNGETVATATSDNITFNPESPGAYRAEAWLKVDGEDRIWIYTNPIYLR